MNEPKPEYSIQTPMGILRAFVRVNGKIVNSNESDVASCLLASQEYSPMYMTLPERCGIVFRCSTKEKIRQITFECRWEESATANKGRPECDKGLNALRWTGSGHTILVGTEDAGALQDRVVRRKNMTQGLRHCLGEITPELDHLIFSYKDDGFIIRLTEIPANEVFQLYYLVAWGAHPEPESEATWLAMDGMREDIHDAMDGLDATLS